MSPLGRYCCKSLFALVIKNSPGCRRDFRVKMWGTSSPDDKLTGDLGNVIESTQIGGRRSDRLMAGKLSPSNFGLLQQNLPIADICSAAKLHPIRSSRRHGLPYFFPFQLNFNLHPEGIEQTKRRPKFQIASLSL